MGDLLSIAPERRGAAMPSAWDVWRSTDGDSVSVSVRFVGSIYAALQVLKTASQGAWLTALFWAVSGAGLFWVLARFGRSPASRPWGQRAMFVTVWVAATALAVFGRTAWMQALAVALVLLTIGADIALARRSRR